MAKHVILDGKVQLYRRGDGENWHCAAHIGGARRRQSTKVNGLAQAMEFAEDWYFNLRAQLRAGVLAIKPKGKTFAFAAKQFLDEFEVITQGQRSPRCLESHQIYLRAHLLPFFGAMVIPAITSGIVQDYRVSRMRSSRHGKPPSHVSVQKEIVTLRQVLKTAYRHGWLEQVPDISAPYRTSKKVSHRAWFSPEEYRRFYEATRQRAKTPLNNRWRWEMEQFHDYVLFMANTGLRPDEANNLQYRDVSVVRDRDTGELILEIEVRGKRGVGFCKSTAGAVRPFSRLRKRNNPQPSDLVFPGDRRGTFNSVLDELDLKFDRDGNRRTAYSLRHTYICLRLMEGADIYQIAKNCRTSVEMIEKHYAAHIKNTLDAAAINVRRVKPTLANAKTSSRRRGLVASPRDTRVTANKTLGDSIEADYTQ
jgi:integrase